MAGLISDMSQPLLFEKFPQLRQRLPWISLGHFPTPVERLQNLETRFDCDSLWIKRDDLSGELYGGNKVRTLEFSIAEALKQNAEMVISYSALGSNWPLACTIYARANGLGSEVFYLPYPMDTVKKRNLYITNQLAHKTQTARSLFTFPILFFKGLQKAKKEHKVYLMPPGGTSGVTTLGFVEAVLELQRQCQEGQMPVPDYIICPLGSGGTAAGLAIGLSLIGWHTRVIAVRIVDLIVANRWTLNYLIRRTLNVLRKYASKLELESDPAKRVIIEHHYVGKGYAKPLALAEECMRMGQSEENLRLDSTYTGKAFAAMYELIKNDDFRNKSILFWQTLNSRNLDDGVRKLT